MAPEQFDAPEKVDHRADLYGLGCVLHHALTGRPAFHCDSMTDLMAAKTAAAGPDPRKLVPSIPPEVAALVARLCARAPEDRPQTHAELIAELDRLPAGAASPRSAARRPLLAVAAVVVLGLGWLAWQQATVGAERGGTPAAGPGAAPADAGVATLAPGEPFELFHSGEEPTRAWTGRGDGRWGHDDNTNGASLRSRGGLTTAVRALPRGAFTLRGRVEPRPHSVQPVVRTQAAGLRCEFGDLALQIDLQPAAGPTGYRATARRVVRDGEDAPWRAVEDLGGCTGDFGLEHPLAVALQWRDGRLVCSFGEDGAGAPVEVELRPADGAVAPAALAVFVDRGLACFREFELRGI
jgi:hypothetical protein